MLIQPVVRSVLGDFARRFGLKQPESTRQQDKLRKTEQIVSYLEEIHVKVHKYSRKRPLVLVEPAAGNCYVSFLAYHFYARIEHRPVEVHCIDWNADLMEKNRRVADELGFSGMHFYAGDIADMQLSGRPDIVYALHACDTASDKAVFSGIRVKARNILNVSCCQHGFSRRFRPSGDMRLMAQHQIYRDRFAHMVADAMRAKLLEMVGYRTSLVEFVSSRATGKNLMLRAELQPCGHDPALADTYLALKRMCGTAPILEAYLRDAGLIDLSGQALGGPQPRVAETRKTPDGASGSGAPGVAGAANVCHV